VCVYFVSRLISRMTTLQLTSIIATYSNLENHPRLILARDRKPVPRIELDPKTGLPSVTEEGSQHDVVHARRTARPGTTAREEVLGSAAAEPSKFTPHSGVTVN
jgi:hypothetical protein